MAGFTKLFASITESSVWGEDDKTLRVWIAMLARANSSGFVAASVPGFAHLCHMKVHELQKALKRLSAPDPHSRTPDHEGRRIEAVAGGWLVLNYVAYRNGVQEQPGSRAGDMRRYRQRKKDGPQATVTGSGNEASPVTPGCNALPPVGHGDTEAEAEAEKDQPITRAGDPPQVSGVVNANPAVPPPSREEAFALGERSGIPKECVEKWWLTCDQRLWKDSQGQPIGRWSSSLLSYWMTWQNNGRSGSPGGAAPARGPRPAPPADPSDPANLKI